MPALLARVWFEVGQYPAAAEACLVNHYTAGTKLGSHVDADEDVSIVRADMIGVIFIVTFHAHKRSLRLAVIR